MLYWLHRVCEADDASESRGSVWTCSSPRNVVLITCLFSSQENYTVFLNDFGLNMAQLMLIYTSQFWIVLYRFLLMKTVGIPQSGHSQVSSIIIYIYEPQTNVIFNHGSPSSSQSAKGIQAIRFTTVVSSGSWTRVICRMGRKMENISCPVHHRWSTRRRHTSRVQDKPA